jgi:GT2 family glycosyltransferase
VTEPFISVVVPTYNRRASLQRLLEALDRQSYPMTSFEVIVVDDGSSDGTPELARGKSSAYQLTVLEQQHAGPAAARNRGVAAASGGLIVFLDDDVEPLADLLWQHVATHEVHPNAVVIGPMSPPRDWSRPIWVRWEEEQLLSQYDAMIAGLWSCTARQFYTGNASLARERFTQAGGFDVSFKRAEDVELAYRLHDLGATLVFNPRAEVLHYAFRSFEAWRRTPYQYGRYDVVMHRSGRQTLIWALREFQSRNVLNRALVKLLAGRRRMVGAAVGVLSAAVQVASQLGAYRQAQQGLSAMFGLLYWQGICDEFGGRRVLLALNRDQIPA